MKKYIIPEAGGDAARSAFYFLLDIGIKTTDIVAVDRDSKALIVWNEMLNCTTMTERKFISSSLKNTSIIVPCDEYLREKVGLSSALAETWRNPATLFNKIDQYEFLYKKKLSNCYLPQRLDFSSFKKTDMFISRENRSSGSKSVRILTYEDALELSHANKNCLITEYISFDTEIVCDFVSYKGKVICSPRISYQLKNGADTYVKILDTTCILYKDVCSAVEELVKLFRYKGVGNVQFGQSQNSLCFIEFSPRISGSSYLNLQNFNPLRYIMTDGRFGITKDYREKKISNKFLLPYGRMFS